MSEGLPWRQPDALCLGSNPQLYLAGAADKFACLDHTRLAMETFRRVG